MNKIETYLNNIKPKELIYIFLSIPIIVFIVYYNFVYPKITKENKHLISKLQSTKKTLSSTISKIRIIKKTENLLPSTKKKLDNLRGNFKYIKYNLAYLELIKLDNLKVYKVLKDMLNQANTLHLSVSFDIKWDQKYPPYNQVISIDITGDGNYINIIQYLHYIENIDNIILVNNFSIGKDDKSTTAKKTQTFDIKLLLMGEK